MTREARIRSAGMLFYIVLLVTLLLTGEGMRFTADILNNVSENTEDTQSAENRENTKNTDWAGTLVAVAALGTAVFTSDAIGWVFGAITMFFWPISDCHRPSRYFYATEWLKLAHDLRQRAIDDYDRERESQDSDKDTGLDERWKKYSADVFLSYFWQRAPKTLVEWASRRNTAFFVYASSGTGILFALLLSILLKCSFDLGTTCYWCIAVSISLLLMVFLWLTSHAPRTEAWQIIDLWLRAAFDPRMKKVLNAVEQDLLLKIERHDSKPW